MHYKKKLFLNKFKTCFKCIDLNIEAIFNIIFILQMTNHFNNRFSNNQCFIIEFIQINEKHK